MTDPTNNTPQPRSLPRSVAGAIASVGFGYLIINAASRCSWSRGTSDEREGSCVLLAFYGLAAICAVIYTIVSLHRRGLSNKWTLEGRCPKCGYDLAHSKALCPECGPLTQSASPPPGSPAVCARCQGDMTGREGRICPDCGAMYGMEYSTHHNAG